MAYSVVDYTSDMLGPPQAADIQASGSIITLFDAVLVNGFNSIGVASLTRSGGTATLVTSGTNNFGVKTRIELAGVDQTAWNGRYEVKTRPASNTVTFDVDPALPAATTGTITAKHPAAGWTKVFSGTNVACYRMSGGLQAYLQVEDNDPYANSGISFRIRTALGWTALNTAAVLGEATQWDKRWDSVFYNPHWTMTADPRGLFLSIGGFFIHMAQEFGSFLTGDAYNVVNSRGRETTAGFAGVPTVFTGAAFPSGLDGSGSSTGLVYCLLRSVSQVGSNIFGQPLGYTLQPGNTGLTSALVPQPNAADGSYPLLPSFVVEASPYALRGKLRGLWHLLGTPSISGPSLVADDVLIGGVPRRVRMVTFGVSSGQRATALDVSPDWS